jgi:hypothetical protein
MDIKLRYNQKGTCLTTDNAISGDRNVITKEAQNIFKHRELTTEIQRMWNVKTEIISLIIGSTRTTSKSFRSYLNDTS